LEIDLSLNSFLEENNFVEIWERIRKNNKNNAGLLKHFHIWFDGFKTLKLIHYLTEHKYPQMDMFLAVEKLFRMMGHKVGSNKYRQFQALKHR